MIVKAGRPSRRYGVEWSNRWRATPWLAVDFDLAWNHARFTGSAPEGDYIPGAPEVVTSRLKGKPLEGVNDTHIHPGEPRSLRVSLSYRF